MKGLLLIILMTIATSAYCQPKNDSLPKPTVVNVVPESPTDSTDIISARDINRVLVYLQDKLIAKDYLLVQEVLQQVYNIKQKSWMDNKKKKDKPQK